MFCTDIEVITYEDNKSRLQPRDRYLTYYQDLANYYLDIYVQQSALEGGQYHAVELASPILQTLKKRGLTTDVDLCFIADWAPDFDPEYSAFGPFVVDHLNLNARLYSIIDQGLMAPVTALKMIKACFESKKATKSLLLTIEQTTIPQFQNSESIKPDENGSAGLIISSRPIGLNPWQIQAMGIESLQIDELLTRIASNHQIHPESISIDHATGIGLLPFFKSIKKVMLRQTDTAHLIIVKDVETDNSGYIFLQRFTDE